MFSIFKKKHKKFVIILSAGRCGSTYLIEELNKIPHVNIYGENYNLFSKLAQAIYAIRKILSIVNKKNSIKAKIFTILKHFQDDTKCNYTGGEFYNDNKALQKNLTVLETSIEKYFGNYSVSGFKEIRFWNIDMIKPLQYFEEKYTTYYIHLTRNIDEQVESGFWKDAKSARQSIIKINKNIEEVLGKKERYLKVDISEISHDISLIKKFIEIY